MTLISTSFATLQNLNRKDSYIILAFFETIAKGSCL